MLTSKLVAFHVSVEPKDKKIETLEKWKKWKNEKNGENGIWENNFHVELPLYLSSQLGISLPLSFQFIEQQVRTSPQFKHFLGIFPYKKQRFTKPCRKQILARLMSM